MRAGLTNQRKSRRRPPRCILIAGPNGAGKTTFAEEWLKNAGINEFLNVDAIARGFNSLKPNSAAIYAARWMIDRMNDLIAQRKSFAFESTLSGAGHLARLRIMRESGYRIEIVFIRLASPRVALERVAARVRQGGHHVPTKDVLRRFDRGWARFVADYRPLAHSWAVYDNTGETAVLMENGP